MDFKYLLKIFIVSFLILSLIIFINFAGIYFNEPNYQKDLTNVITMEGLENNNILLNNPLLSNQNNPLNLSSSDAFCKVNKGAQQENSCINLTQDNCNQTSCCIWTSDKKCKAGNQDGPLFGSDSNGKTIPLDYYYFQNKCYGKKCPK
jgi:regulatory protein YycI of two-component signal transduction system YycFG